MGGWHEKKIIQNSWQTTKNSINKKNKIFLKILVKQESIEKTFGMPIKKVMPSILSENF